MTRDRLLERSSIFCFSTLSNMISYRPLYRLSWNGATPGSWESGIGPDSVVRACAPAAVDLSSGHPTSSSRHFPYWPIPLHLFIFILSPDSVAGLRLAAWASIRLHQASLSIVQRFASSSILVSWFRDNFASFCAEPGAQ